MMTDSFIDAAKIKLDDNSFASSIALITTSNIGGRLSCGYLDVVDLKGLLKFPSELVIVKVLGDKLMGALEHSVRNFCEILFNGQFLQMSGLRVVFDVSKPQGSRVVSVKIRDSQSSYKKLNLTKEYNVIITKHLYSGGDGFTMFNVRF